jgi:hypothetical protein
MNFEAQRDAIQLACGWSVDHNPDCEFLFRTATGRGLFNPLSCLNAMHEAEKVLTLDQTWRQIKAIVDYQQLADGLPLLSRSESIKLHSATAAQRAEAFLRTIGKWEESA